MFRRTKSEPEPPAPPAKPGGKGRPTPTRKEAEALARARAKAAPKTRREVALAARQERMRSRDAGPVRHFARDLIDSRLMVMELVLPMLLLSLVFGWSGVDRLVIIGNLMAYVVFLTMIFEILIIRFRVRREVARRFPEESLTGLTFYAVGRAMQPRFMRLPKPTVKIGHPLPEHYY